MEHSSPGLINLMREAEGPEREEMYCPALGAPCLHLTPSTAFQPSPAAMSDLESSSFDCDCETTRYRLELLEGATFIGTVLI